MIEKKDEKNADETPDSPPAYVINLTSAIDVLQGILDALKEIQKQTPYASLSPLGVDIVLKMQEDDAKRSSLAI